MGIIYPLVYSPRFFDKVCVLEYFLHLEFLALHYRLSYLPVLLCLQVYKQKVKHLLYEHQNNITELKRDGSVAVTLEQSDHQEREGGLIKEKRSLKVCTGTACSGVGVLSVHVSVGWAQGDGTGSPGGCENSQNGILPCMDVCVCSVLTHYMHLSSLCVCRGMINWQLQPGRTLRDWPPVTPPHTHTTPHTPHSYTPTLHTLTPHTHSTHSTHSTHTLSWQSFSLNTKPRWLLREMSWSYAGRQRCMRLRRWGLD